MKSYVLISFFILSLTATQALAQGGSSGAHGGSAVACKGEQTVTLDYYNATLKAIDGVSPDLIDIASMSSQEVIDIVLNRYRDAGNTYFVDLLQAALHSVGPIGSWTATSLKEVTDSGAPYMLPPGCVSETAAARQDNPVRMYGDPSVIQSLSSAQQGILMLHEALYVIAFSHGQTTSSNVRDFLKILLLKDPNTSPLVQNGADPLYVALDLVGEHEQSAQEINLFLAKLPTGRYTWSAPYFSDLLVDTDHRTVRVDFFRNTPTSVVPGDFDGYSELSFQCDPQPRNEKLGVHLFCESGSRSQRDGCNIFLYLGRTFGDPTAGLFSDCDDPAQGGWDPNTSNAHAFFYFWGVGRNI